MPLNNVKSDDANIQIGNADVGADNPVPVGNTVSITVTPTISAGAIYAAGDALGGRFELQNAVLSAGGAGTITTVVVIDDDSEESEMDFVLFSTAFTATADNAPFDPSDADLENCIGHIPFTQAHYSTFNDNSAGAQRNVGFEFETAAGQTSIWGQAVARETPTYTATTDLTFKFVIQRQ